MSALTPQAERPIGLMRVMRCLGLIGCVMAAGCTPVHPLADGPAVLLDRGLAESRRTRAVQHISLDDPQSAEAIAALHVLVWSDRHPLNLRIAAMDRLIGHDAEGFWRAADRWFPSVDDDAMAAQIGERAIRDARRDVLPAVLRRWAKLDPSIAEARRLEYSICRVLVAPQSVNQWLWHLVGAAPGENGSHTQDNAFTAWAVLCRLENPAQRRAVLATDFSSEAFVNDLRTAARVLDVLPANAEGLRWLLTFREPTDTGMSPAFRRLRDGLHPDAPTGLAVRHVSVLWQMSADRRAWSRDEFLRALTGRLASVRKYPRDIRVGREIYVENTDDRALCWADLAVALQVREAMDKVDIAAAWFAQADADLSDTTSEHGGVLTWDERGRLVADAFPPTRRDGDHKFFSPPRLIDAMHRGLAHYHFHAQQFDHAEFAGPGRGDLAFTDAMEAHTLTLTFVDRDRLNVDLAFPGGWVLDLGCIHRPTVD